MGISMVLRVREAIWQPVEASGAGLRFELRPPA
jgi:hypothetical protein